MIARNVRVVGRVQGVFFRAWTADHAAALGVTGWVRNAPDGSVEAHLQGQEQSVERLIDLLRHGPPAARVEQLDVENAEAVAGEGFEVRH